MSVNAYLINIQFKWKLYYARYFLFSDTCNHNIAGLRLNMQTKKSLVNKRGNI